jgi:hypothetical protein
MFFVVAFASGFGLVFAALLLISWLIWHGSDRQIQRIRAYARRSGWPW